MAIALLLGLLSGVLLFAAVLAWAWKYAVILAVGTALLMLAGKIAERSDRKKLSASARP